MPDAEAVVAWALERAIPEPNSGCWLWLLALTRDGYAHTSSRGGSSLAHKRVYEALHGRLRRGRTLDHSCRVRCCINPAHVAPVSNRKNLRRGFGATGRWRNTYCHRGHKFTRGNVYRHPTTGTRQCRACRREGYHRRKAHA